MSKETITVEVDGVEEEREIDYSDYRGKNREGEKIFVHYPKLKHERGRYEHIWEDDFGISIFTSLVK